MNTRDYSNEFKFMLLCLRDDIEVDEETISHSEINWGVFLDLVIHHRVYSIVFLKLKNLGSNSILIPQEIMNKLQQLFTKNAYKMLELTREMGVVCKRFAENDVPLILLKGPVLAVTLYGDISRRTSKDLDLFVDVEDVNKSMDILLESGYQMKDEKLLNNWLIKTHHLSFVHPVHHVQIELHWRLNPNLRAAPTFKDFWNRKNEVSISNQTYYYLGNEDLLLYLSEHGSRHGWSRLRWLMDIDRLLKNHSISSVRLQRSLKQYKVKHFVKQAILLSHYLLSSEPSIEISKIIPFKKSNKQLERVIERIEENCYSTGNMDIQYDWYFFLLMSSGQKLHYVRMLFTPSSKDASMLPLSKRYHFIYFFLRPFLLILRLLKRGST
ncbi:nucleotidyltransferase family protein [Cytobacillus firmus]|uniref:nucleotidyltransferase domain-containing protein n=1 Tax=Paenibacillus lautus TaxID=1401 RepID=UPI00384D61C4|nr:nucleotidyltransferase family protein [Cytobacillus firmus]